MFETKLHGGPARRIALGAFGAMVVAAAAAAGSPSAAAAPHEYSVTMNSMSYGGLPASAKVGDTIVWINRDTVPHSATARDRSFDVRVGQGQSVRMTLKKAGTVAIYCLYHPAMRGTLNVTP